MSNCTPEVLQEKIDKWFGGSEGRTRHPLNRRFIYTEGLKDVAETAGAYWLLDIIATECAPLLMRMWEADQEHMLFLDVNVFGDRTAILSLERDIDTPILWRKDLEFTDFPVGAWKFYLCIDGIIDSKGEVVVGMVPTEY